MAPTLLTEMVICSEGEARSVYLDAEGNERPAPHDCRNCPACNLPTMPGGGEIPALATEIAWFSATYATYSPSARLSPRRVTMQARAPPTMTSLNDHPIALAPQAGAGFRMAHLPPFRQDDAVVSGITVSTSGA